MTVELVVEKPTHREIRSCVLAGFCRHLEGKIAVKPDEFGKVMHELGVEQFPRHKVRRALDSLVYSDAPGVRRLERRALGNGVRVYLLTERHAPTS